MRIDFNYTLILRKLCDICGIIAILETILLTNANVEKQSRRNDIKKKTKEERNVEEQLCKPMARHRFAISTSPHLIWFCLSICAHLIPWPISLAVVVSILHRRRERKKNTNKRNKTRAAYLNGNNTAKTSSGVLRIRIKVTVSRCRTDRDMGLHVKTLQPSK